MIASLIVLPVPKANAQTWSAPASADRQANPNAEGSPRRAEELYRGNCLPCHGSVGKGDGPAGAYLQPKAADLTTPAVHAQSDGALLWKIGKGRSPMPGFGGVLDEDELWQLVTYLRGLATAEAKEAIPAQAVEPAPRTWP
ncbi:MAG: cytochrome c, partial [Rhodothermaceae bacterium]|nr:cytochrome c [Rhodothermaceae bacterium]